MAGRLPALDLTVGEDDCANITAMHGKNGQETAATQNLIVGMWRQADHAVQAIQGQWDAPIVGGFFSPITHAL